jgi:hypothetical protein
MIDASPGTGPNDIHDYVPEDDVSIIMNREELFGEQDEIIDMAADSNVMIFSPINNALQYWRHPDTNPNHDSESVCIEPTVDTNDSLDCTNEDEVILSLLTRSAHAYIHTYLFYPYVISNPLPVT